MKVRQVELKIVENSNPREDLLIPLFAGSVTLWCIILNIAATERKHDVCHRYTLFSFVIKMQQWVSFALLTR